MLLSYVRTDSTRVRINTRARAGGGLGLEFGIRVVICKVFNLAVIFEFLFFLDIIIIVIWRGLSNVREVKSVSFVVDSAHLEPRGAFHRARRLWILHHVIIVLDVVILAIEKLLRRLHHLGISLKRATCLCTGGTLWSGVCSVE